MKLVGLFDAFLQDTVNLNASRIAFLEQKVEAVERALRSSDYAQVLRSVAIKGSFAQQTIIKPPKNRHEFDADMVLYVREKDGWSASDYIDQLYNALRAAPPYCSMVSRKTRCVTLDYEGDFHLDLVPITVRRPLLSKTTYRVCNRTIGDFEPTDGQAYEHWWNNKAEILGDDLLAETIRALKYLRDIKGRFSCKSILLTTLIARQIQDKDRGAFSDVPTVLKVMIGRLDDFLAENPKMPRIENPVLPGEDFNRHWDQKKYSNFRGQIGRYRRWIDDAYDEDDLQESVGKWRDLFGSSYARAQDIHSPRFVSTYGDESAVEETQNGRAIVVAGLLALVAILR